MAGLQEVFDNNTKKNNNKNKPAKIRINIHTNYSSSQTTNDTDEYLEEQQAEFNLKEKSLQITSLALFYRDVHRHKLLTADEEKFYSRQVKQGSKTAREKMINSNQRLVIKIALRYANRGIELLELINEGNFGLMKAVDMFDPERGFKFATYAVWWIRSTIEKVIINLSRDIKVSHDIAERIKKIFKSTIKLEEALGRKSSLSERAKKLNLSAKKVAELEMIAVKTISFEADGTIFDNNNKASFLNDNEAEINFHEIISSINTPSQEDETLSVEIKKILNRGLKSLTTTEKNVIVDKFGFYGEELALKKIGFNYNVSHERIRQIQEKALQKLKTFCRRNDIFNEDFW